MVRALLLACTIVALPLSAAARTASVHVPVTLDVGEACTLALPILTAADLASEDATKLESMLSGCSLSGAAPALFLTPDSGAAGAYVATINF